MSDGLGPVREVLDARAAATRNQIDVAVAKKGQDAAKQQGEAMVDLVRQAAVIQEQLAAGRLDVRI